MWNEKRIGECCKICTERHYACHDTCDKYKQASDEWYAYKDMVRKAKKPTEYDLYRMTRRRHDRKN